MRLRKIRPKTEPTIISPILPALSQGPDFASGSEIWVGVVVEVAADDPADVGREVLSVMLAVEADSSVVLGLLGGITVTSGVGSEVMNAIDVTNWMDVTRDGGGFAPS